MADHDFDSSLDLSGDSTHELTLGASASADSQLSFHELPTGWSFDPTDSMSVEVCVTDEAGRDVAKQAFDQPFVLIGRSPDCDMRLEDERVSFRHAYLQRIFGRVLCVDLDSRTGTVWPRGPKAYGWFDETHPVTIGPYRLELIPRPSAEKPSEPEMDPSAFFRAQVKRRVLPNVTLQYLARTGPGETWKLKRPITLVGSSPRCKLRLRHESVSRVHCSLLLMPDGLWVVDLLGRDGTLVDDKLVRHARIPDGSTLKLGRYTFRVAYESPAADAPMQNLPGPTALTTGMTEHFVTRLVDQISQMQMQFLEQSRQQTEMMMQFFGAAQANTHELLRNEMNRVNEIDKEMRELRAMMSRGGNENRPESPRSHIAPLSPLDDPETSPSSVPLSNDFVRKQLDELRAAIDAKESKPRRRRSSSEKKSKPAPHENEASHAVDAKSTEEPGIPVPIELIDAPSHEATRPEPTTDTPAISIEDTPTSLADAEPQPSESIETDVEEEAEAGMPDPHAWVLQRMEKLNHERQGILKRMFRSIVHSGR